MPREPAACVEDGAPLFVVGLAQAHAAAHLVRQPRRQLVGEEAAHFGTEGFLFCGKAQVHRRTRFLPVRAGLIGR
jgi:hypothetical protein